MKIAVYPGSFDPVTLGHVDIATRAAALCDRLIVGVYEAPPKNLLFSTQERVELMRQAVSHLPNVEVTAYSELTMDFIRRMGSRAYVRGLRMNSDFEREFEMALMNKVFASDIELLCLMCSQEYQFLSSSLLKEAAALGADVSRLVPDAVAQALKKKFAARRRA
ncbi:MAG: pantetheine-phosphate adenylyltransferase [Chloroflexi bacterium]|nr:pantetheine-phosphate adenylyltransferase [Chloroflexota bacterium]